MGTVERKALGVLLAAVVAAGWPDAVPASIEDFENWGLSAQEGDDEYGLDYHFLFYAPGWEGEWRFADGGARAYMGCTTNEVWELANEVRVKRELARAIRFRYDFLQLEGLGHANQQHVVAVELDALGFRVGPFAKLHAEKARHDLGVGVGRMFPAGVDVTLAVSFEDANSDLVNERSSIGDRASTDYEDRAVEWLLEIERLVTPRRWLAVEARLLPEFAKRIMPRPIDDGPAVSRTIGGAEARFHGSIDPTPSIDLEWRVHAKEGRREDHPEGGSATDVRRSSWIGLARVSHPLAQGWRGHWGIQGRRNRERDEAKGADPYRFDVDEIAGTGGASRWFLAWLRGEVGYAHQNTKVERTGRFRPSHGTRREDRIYVVAEIELDRFRARLHESIELNDEGYSGHLIDKGLVQIQVEF